jgi:MtrB/PioB family decaheme-associated outer membrane protein
MKRLLILAMVFFLMAAPALALDYSGDLSIGGRFVDGSNTEKSAKFLEYRDLDDQLTSDIDVRATADNFFLSVSGGNFGYDDQGIKLDGGIYGQLKFSLFYDELTHNYSLDDLSAYNGVGTNTLTIPANIIADPNNTSLWLPLDYAMERQVIGAKIELDFNTPFFVVINVTQTEKEGIMPWGVNIDNVTGGSEAAELPAPIDNVTTNLMVKAGYRTKRFFAQGDITFSTFENDSSRFTLPNEGDGAASNDSAFDFISGNSQTVYMAPDNDMIQVGGQLTLRDLPMNSVLAIRASHAVLESDSPASGVADGELTYTKAAFRIRSRPMAKLDTELSYNFLQKDNKAASFLYNGNQTHVFEYTKQHALLSGSYKVNRENRVKLGYDYLRADRSEMRFDAEETDEHTVFAEWKNSTFDLVTGKVRYEHMERSSEFNGAQYAIAKGNAVYNYIYPYDLSDKSQDKIRFMVDVTPAESVDMGVEFNASTADYDDTIIGRTEESGYEFIFDASISLPRDIKLYGYASYEKFEASSSHARYGPAFLSTVVPIPAASEAANYYNWSVKREDIGKSLGLKLDVPIFSGFNVSAAFDYTENDGEADFYTNPATASPDLADIAAYNDYEKQALDLKAKYVVKENMTIIAGYVYEKYELDDLAYNDYVNVPGNGNYFTGAYADMDYEANIGYVSLTYKF